MRRAVPVALLLVLLAPGAAGWSAHLVTSPADVSLRESLLVAGALSARSQGGAFGAPRATLLSFDAPVDVRMCPDQAGERQAAQNCPGPQDSTQARLYIRAGGLVVVPAPDASAELRSAATVGALGGPNVTLNGIPVGAAIYTGGATVVTVNGTAFAIRPLGSLASIEVRGDEGFRTYNGTGFTLYVTNASAARLEARGAFLGGDGLDVQLGVAPLPTAEREIRVADLFDLLRALQPPERADRRADLTTAFGPFQLVPALLDGAAAARANLTLNGALQEGPTFLRVSDLRLGYEGANWTGSGNATYVVQGDLLAPTPGARARFPVAIPLLLVAGALAARALTPREMPRRRVRLTGHAVRLAGLVLTGFVAGAALAPLLGFSPLLDARVLGLRSRVQLALLVAGMVGTAWLGFGLPAESLARSVFAWRHRPRARIVPVLAGLAATALVLLLATPTLLSLVARFVRL